MEKVKKKAKKESAKIKTSLSQPVRAAMIALAALQIIFGLINCFTSKMMSEELSASFRESAQSSDVTYEDEEMQEAFNDAMAKLQTLFDNSWIIFVLNGIIIIVSNTFILIWSIQEKLLIKKPKAITLCAISLAFSNSTYNFFFSLVSLVIMIVTKRKIPEDFGNKAKKLKVKFEEKKE